MIKFENVVTPSEKQWESLILGARNAMNSWEKSDSDYRKVLSKKCDECGKYNLPDENSCDECWINNYEFPYKGFVIGPTDLDLMMRLRNAGTDHRKFMRMITVYVDITAPLYWWKEFDTYKVGTVANSCSTMHKIHAKEFTLDDFSHEHLICSPEMGADEVDIRISPMQAMLTTIECLNGYRDLYLKTKDKKYWWQMIQLLPSSYNQKRTVMLNYEVLANIYKSRRKHKLDEWAETKLTGDCPADMYPSKFTIGFCDWIKTLPYSELITE